MQSTCSTQTAHVILPRLPHGLIESVGQHLMKLGCALAQFLSPTDKLEVRKGHRNGQPIWYIYDGYSNQKLEFTSEQAIRDWLGA